MMVKKYNYRSWYYETMSGKRREKFEQNFPAGFLSFWLTLCKGHDGKTAPSWRALIDDHLAGGKVIPGYDTDWRGIFALERPGWPIPESCPYTRETKVFPNGWSQRNIQRYTLALCAKE